VGPQWLSGFLAEASIDVCRDIDQRTCKVFGKEGGRLRAAGMMVSDCDLSIGATALRHDRILLTNNRHHCERIASLRIESLELLPTQIP
jgi:predicted nucleic acid-binding protein